MSCKKRLYVALVWILTLLVCLLEVWYLVNKYMSYETSNKMAVAFKEDIRIPTVFTCFDTDWNGTDVSEFFADYVRPDNNPLTLLRFPNIESDRVVRKAFSSGEIDRALSYINVTSSAKGRMKCTSLRFYKKTVSRSIISDLATSTSLELSPLWFKTLILLAYNRNQETCYSAAFYLLSPDEETPIADQMRQLVTTCDATDKTYV